MSAPHPTAIDTADPAPLRLFKQPPPDPPHLSDLRGLFKGLPKPQPLFTETESEVMPPERNSADSNRLRRDDTRPPATGANRLAEIAAWVQKLTYGEMIELAAALWKHANPPMTDWDDLPPMWHQWSQSLKAKEDKAT